MMINNNKTFKEMKKEHKIIKIKTKTIDIHYYLFINNIFNILRLLQNFYMNQNDSTENIEKLELYISCR